MIPESAAYGRDRQWSDQFIPEIRRIVGPRLLVTSTLEQDREQAADLVVLRGKDVTIGCRVRRPGYADKYPGQFTIRSHRDSGARTELQKIVDGWGDWLFYGHAGEGATIPVWMIIDLAAFRAHLIRDTHKAQKKRIDWGTNKNGDGTSFTWFDATSFVGEPKLLIDSENIVKPV